VHGNELHLLATYRSIYDFALAALETGWRLRDLLRTDLSGIVLDYGEVYALRTQWRFLPAFDHPWEPGRCVVSAQIDAASGLNWQYQGSGDCLCGHDEAMTVFGLPAVIHLPELAAAYVIGEEGLPRRVGVALGLRGPQRSILGPELIVEADLHLLQGEARLLRAGCKVWSREFSASPLTLTLAGVEPDHFQRALLRRPGYAHVHFFGAKLFSAADYPIGEDGDEVEMESTDFGRKLHSRILAEEPTALPVAALPL
jgi:hypothetical protein